MNGGDPTSPASESRVRPTQGRDHIRTIVAEDLASGRHRKIVTRFPPEPNGYLHIGHATSICLNFGISLEFDGTCHLRFDDTNPETEDVRFVDSIVEDVAWLGFDWGEHLYFASDYFERMYRFAEYFIEQGNAYVDSLDEESMREYRGTVTEPGRPSPYRDRSVEENLDLFRRMRAGEFPDGAHVLRGKLDLASPNMLLRDPVLYRIRNAHHYRTGDTWSVYPLYDFAHPIEDAIEGVTHSICTLEFENNRPLYDWVVRNLPRGDQPGDIAPTSRPRQYEFARRNLEFTVMSKRKFLELVRGEHVTGWDDPRMPTIAGMRRRGFTPASIRAFADMAGVGRNEIRIDMGKLEFSIRDDLNPIAPRVLCVLKPLRVVLTNYPEDRVEYIDAPYFPRDVEGEGSRELPFSRVLYIDRDDFEENPPEGYHRLAPGREVRLRYGYVIRCDEVVRNETGEIEELRCTYQEKTEGAAKESAKSSAGTPIGTIHWVSAEHAIPCEVRLYDRLFTVPDPDGEEGDFRTYLNPDSLVVAKGALIEPSVADDPADTRYQFERLGYFWRDPVDSREDALVFNRTVTLRDTWSNRQGKKTQKSQAPEQKPRRKAPPAENAAPALRKAPAEFVRSPELEERRRRFVTELGVAEDEAEIITRDPQVADFFEAALLPGVPARSAANWVVHELPREAGGTAISELRIDGAGLGGLVAMIEAGRLSSASGRIVLADILKSGESAEAIVARRGLDQVSDPDALREIAVAVVAENPAKAAEYRGGREGLLGFFMGQAMRRSGGRANPEVVRDLVVEALRAD